MRYTSVLKMSSSGRQEQRCSLGVNYQAVSCRLTARDEAGGFEAATWEA